MDDSYQEGKVGDHVILLDLSVAFDTNDQVIFLYLLSEMAVLPHESHVLSLPWHLQVRLVKAPAWDPVKLLLVSVNRTALGVKIIWMFYVAGIRLHLCESVALKLLLSYSSYLLC